MSYRRDTDKHRAWEAWIAVNRDALLRTSLPEFIFSDQQRWLRFIEHDGWDQESGWNIKILSPVQLLILLDLCSKEANTEYDQLRRTLKRVLNRS